MNKGCDIMDLQENLEQNKEEFGANVMVWMRKLQQKKFYKPDMKMD